ncbi:MAG: S-methyl-5-thioribose-1-phosphate isomerase [Bacteroidales bacterium]|nr:S-methyl-5-thioribose-1-phosphate isomerase [Bacteroidales bacterium]MCF8397843.1 S-methyl-5-thioribose-1-phosphate isomerase [Bacteroidales bacterium]
MKVKGKNYRTVWMEGSSVFMIEQNLLPFKFEIFEAKKYFDTCFAITTMIVRGAGALGAAAGYAMAQVFLEAPEEGRDEFIAQARFDIEATRPTAQNLFYAVKRVYKAGKHSVEQAVAEANKIADEDAEDSRSIGLYGNELIKKNAKIATHCNAGWLAFVDFGTALSPIYMAKKEKKKIFVYVDETRPRSQGARLTAWELKNARIPHIIIPDNATAYLMAKGKIDMMIVGADRIVANGDTANKIGTLGKAIAAYEFGIPFYVAAPTSTFDLGTKTGNRINIEERNQDEVIYQTGMDRNGNIATVQVTSPGSRALNIAFDVTPSKYITGFITEKGVITPEEDLIREIATKDE